MHGPWAAAPFCHDCRGVASGGYTMRRRTVTRGPFNDQVAVSRAVCRRCIVAEHEQANAGAKP